MRTNWRTRAVAILMGCLVGPYTGLFPSLVFAVIVSALVLAIPALTSVLIDPALAHRTATLVSVGVCALLVGSLLVAGAAFPAVW
ncbi:MAG TPA: hypothetical protein VH137_09100 [Gemmatimonadales bacterium]|nr:hypothetical protein [Gemmatimonadales bacterium]